MSLGSESDMCLGDGENELWPLARRLGRVCSSAIYLDTFFSLVGDRLLGRNFLTQGSRLQMSLARGRKRERCHLWIHCIQWKLLLATPFCYPETLEGNLIRLLSPQGMVGLTARFFLRARNGWEQKKEWKEQLVFTHAPGINWRGRVHAAFWVQSAR